MLAGFVAGAATQGASALSPELELAFKLLGVIGAVLGALAAALAFFLKRYWENRDRKLRATHERALAAQQQEWRHKEAEWQAAQERELAAQEREWRRKEAEWQAAQDRQLATEASRDRLRDILYESLRWFEKETQRRSIGISIVEASWELFPEFRPVWLAVLANQAVYLLVVSEQKDKAHEIANLMRIMQMLVRHRASLDLVALEAVQDALEKKIAKTVTSGLLVDPSALEKWLDALRGTGLEKTAASGIGPVSAS